MSTLYLFIGISGSGKTKWISDNVNSFTDPYVVSMDKIRLAMGDIDNQQDNNAVYNIAKGQMRGASGRINCINGKDESK